MSLLTKLLCKSAPFVWSEAQQSSFNNLKSVLTQASILVQPESDQEFVVYSDLWELYWWLGLELEVDTFVSHCLTCQKAKVEHQLPSGLLQLVKIPQWKWERVTMDFVTGLPLTPTKKDSIWVIADRLTKLAHFIPIRTDYSLQKLAKLFITEILRLHEILVSVISERNCIRP